MITLRWYLVLAGGSIPAGGNSGLLAASPSASLSQCRHRVRTSADLGMTGRQSEVLALLIQGKPNKLICRELGLAEGTVKIHVTAILRALVSPTARRR